MSGSGTRIGAIAQRWNCVRSISLFVLAALFQLIAVSFNASGAEAERPNIVILYADDMGYGDLACQNPDSKIPTPNLDRLAAEGTRFTDAHSSSGVCTPSRYAMLMGRYHWRKFHGIVNSFDPPVLDKERTTLAELLRAQGYRTACIGKWHLGWDWKSIQRDPNQKPDPKEGYPPEAFDWTRPLPGGPLDHGFDYYFGDDVPNFPPYTWFENDRLLAPPTERLQTKLKTAEGNFETRPGPAVADWDFYAVMPRLTDKAVQWIGKQTVDQPFFLYFPFTSPHAPIVPTDRFRNTSQAGGYGDFVAQTDAVVGAIMEALEAGGHRERTIVIFSSDNGPETYAYERIRRFGHRSMGPLRGLKRDLWEGGHRVPTIIRWPGKVPAGKVNNGLLSQIDLFATIAGIVGAEIPSEEAEDSLDQRELVLGTGPSARTELVHNTQPNGYAIRAGNWVLIQARTGGVSKVPDWFDTENGYSRNEQAGELYDLGTDLGQRHNRYRENPAKVMELQERLRAIRGEEVSLKN
jgi:arylsulfatase A